MKHHHRHKQSIAAPWAVLHAGSLTDVAQRCHDSHLRCQAGRSVECPDLQPAQADAGDVAGSHIGSQRPQADRFGDIHWRAWQQRKRSHAEPRYHTQGQGHVLRAAAARAGAAYSLPAASAASVSMQRHKLGLTATLQLLTVVWLPADCMGQPIWPALAQGHVHSNSCKQVAAVALLTELSAACGGLDATRQGQGLRQRSDGAAATHLMLLAC